MDKVDPKSQFEASMDSDVSSSWCFVNDICKSYGLRHKMLDEPYSDHVSWLPVIIWSIELEHGA